MKIAAKEAEKKLKARSEAELKRLEKKKPGVASIINQLTHAYDNPDEIPIMPTCAYSEQRHRVKLARVSIQSGERAINTLVARPVNRKEIRANPKAQEALDVEWNKLVKKTAWLYDTVAEWKTVSEKAKKSGKKVHVGKVFEICVEKGSELPEGHKLRKFKGRTVFQGNYVMDENSDTALFSELGSSPATMEAGKAVDAYGCQPGHTAEQNDGVQAYTQALMEGVETWVEVPRDRWPKKWIGKFVRPVVLLRIALYGHPDSGGLWERHCEAMLIAVGFIMPDPVGWPSVFFRPELKLLLVVYVDDFKMAGPKESMPKGEVDVLVIGDSSTALVEAPDDPKHRKVLSIGELLKGNRPAEVRNVYTKMRWGKGLGSIVTGIWEAMDEINRDCDQKGIERKKILVMVGWAGNDVYGDHGYRGCSWIHERRYNQTPADRKVSAEFVEKQYRRVENAVNELVKLKRHGQILDIVVFGCGDAGAYGLQPSYQVEMGKWFDILPNPGHRCFWMRRCWCLRSPTLIPS
eukprot:s3960_g4.t1